MNKINFIMVLFTLTLSTSVFSQEIDERLVKNKGEQAQSAFKYNTNAYNYMLFELDFGYQVVSKKELTKDERKLVQTLPDLTGITEQIAVIGTDKFNYSTLGVSLKSKEKQYFQLPNNKILILLPIAEITQLFIKHPSNTK
jgi:hypothetical protein